MRHELRDHDLLFLGDGHAEGLVVGLLRSISKQILVGHDRQVWLHTSALPEEAAALRAIWRRRWCRVFGGGSVDMFVEELNHRYRSAYPDPITELPNDPFSAFIHISYAAEDRPAALHLSTALEQGGLTVWLDQQQIAAGDDYSRRSDTPGPVRVRPDSGCAPRAAAESGDC
jgi:hypothetical protein